MKQTPYIILASCLAALTGCAVPAAEERTYEQRKGSDIYVIGCHSGQTYYRRKAAQLEMTGPRGFYCG